MFGDAVPIYIMDGQKLGQMFKVLSDKLITPFLNMPRSNNQNVHP